MRYLIDTTNALEYFVAVNAQCYYCLEGRDDDSCICEDKNCPYYYNLINEGEKILYTGRIGSGVSSLFSIDFKFIREKLFENILTGYDENKNYDKTFVEWVEEIGLDSIKSSLGDMWQVFIIISGISRLYHDYFDNLFNCLPKETALIRGRVSYFGHYFEYIKEYFCHCVTDNDLYSLPLFKFACARLLGAENAENVAYPLIQASINFYAEGKSEINKNKFVQTVKQEYSEMQKSTSLSDIHFDKSYLVGGLEGVAMASFYEILNQGYKFKKCENCGLPFIPYLRSDALYCDRISPQDPQKTCKEYGAIKAYQDNLKNNEAMGLYRKIYMAKQMLVKRNPDIQAYQESFEKFKEESKQWKADVRAGKKLDQEYLDWLKLVKDKKLL